MDGTNLSITVMMGATILAAIKPAVKSDANLRPRFFVFHVLGWIRGSALFCRRTGFDGLSGDRDALESMADMESTPGIGGVIV
jgi:hypothetical protein